MPVKKIAALAALIFLFSSVNTPAQAPYLEIRCPTLDPENLSLFRQVYLVKAYEWKRLNEKNERVLEWIASGNAYLAETDHTLISNEHVIKGDEFRIYDYRGQIVKVLRKPIRHPDPKIDLVMIIVEPQKEMKPLKLMRSKGAKPSELINSLKGKTGSIFARRGYFDQRYLICGPIGKSDIVYKNRKIEVGVLKSGLPLFRDGFSASPIIAEINNTIKVVGTAFAKPREKGPSDEIYFLDNSRTEELFDLYYRTNPKKR